ncbi:MAG TPA: GldG family protein [Saprospiraceae bacterium]|nr:GldG family protein [Saprospiraceae bacterium]
MNKTAKILLAIVALLLVNFLAKFISFRFDLTDNKEYTLSPATKEIVRNIEDKIKVTAYFNDDLPVDLDKSRQDFKDLLSEFYSISSGKVEYEFIAPNKDPQKQEEAMRAGIQPVMVNVREKDQAKQLKAFLGAVISKGEQKDIIPVIQPGTAMEYSLATGIKKLTVKSKPNIGFIQGHGEAPLQELAQVYQTLSILYSVQSVYLTDTSDLSKYKTLVIVKPMDSIPDSHFQKLDQFLANGGSMLLAYDQVDADLQQGNTKVSKTGLAQWLAQKGLEVENALVRDIACGSVQVQQQSDFFSFATPIQFPYLPLIQSFSSHQVTKGLERVILQFASPMNFKGSQGKNFSSLLYTSDQSARQALPIVFDINHQWDRSEFPERQICVGGLLEGNFGGTANARLIVYGDGDFAIGKGRGQQVNEDNVNLLANGVDWLSDDTGLIELRTKAVDTRPIKELEDSKRNLYKYVNFLLPVGLVLAYALFRSSMNRKRRNDLMQEKYS